MASGGIGQTGSLPAREAFGVERLARVGGRGCSRVDPHYRSRCQADADGHGHLSNGTSAFGIGGRTGSERCIKVSVTIPVGSKPVDVAADPKTSTIYVASGLGNSVPVISGRCAT
jgi:hypothetical protein